MELVAGHLFYYVGTQQTTDGVCESLIASRGKGGSSHPGDHYILCNRTTYYKVFLVGGQRFIINPEITTGRSECSVSLSLFLVEC